MMIWWIADSKRLSDERRAIESIDEDWFEGPNWSLDDRGRLRLIFDIALPHRRFRLAMTYYNTFPASPPSVRPVNDTERVSSHQYGLGGELCLSIRSDNWSPNVTGADMVRSAHTLLSLETPDLDGVVSPAPSAHHIPREQALRHKRARFYVDPLSKTALLRDDLGEPAIEVALDYRLHCYIAHPLSIRPSSCDGSAVPVGAPSTLRETHAVGRGYLYVVDYPSPAVKTITTVAQLRAIVGERFKLPMQDTWVCLVRTSDREVLLVQHFSGSADVLVFETVYGPPEPSRSGLDGALLAGKRVGIVGLGSLGSRTATSLARAGVGRFELVDGDILHSGNLERHDADWRDVGRHKSELMANRLRLIHPRIKANPWQTALGAQVSSEAAGSVRSALAGCDLLIDATANPDVFNDLSFIAMQSNRSIVWGAVFAGAIGGEIARSRPGKDPSPHAIRQAMTQFYETADEPPPLAVGRGYDGSIGQDEPLVATDADTSIFAAHMAAFAIDALINEEPSTYQAPAYFIGLKKGWLFTGPFDTRPLQVNAPLRTALQASDEADVDVEFLTHLFESLPHENQDRATDH